MLFAALPLSLLAWEADLYAVCCASAFFAGLGSGLVCSLCAVLPLSSVAWEADLYAICCASALFAGSGSGFLPLLAGSR